MSTLHQESDDREVIGRIKEVLQQRIGDDRFAMWFGDRVRFELERETLWLRVDGEFALERLKGRYLRQVEVAAAEVTGRVVPVKMSLLANGLDVLSSVSAESNGPGNGAAVGVRGRATPRSATNGLPDQRSDSRPASKALHAASARSIRVTDSPLPAGGSGVESESEWGAGDAGSDGHGRTETASARPTPTRAVPARANLRTLGEVGRGDGTGATAEPGQAHDSTGSAGGPTGDGSKATGPMAVGTGRRSRPMTFRTFLRASSNALAATAAEMLASEPRGSAPLCFWGATGTGKTHLLSAIQQELRAKHRLARVILLSAEQFTNDFLHCVRGTGLPEFRKRYRDVDALLLDNVQFVGGKNATLRELLYTVDALLSRGRPLVLAADRQPLEIDGLGGDLAGRMSSGLVLGINPMEKELRRDLFRQHAAHSYLPWDEATIDWLSERSIGDGRVIQGISQLVSMLQRMYRRMPTFQEISVHAGELLQRGPKVVALSDVERAICTTFGISTQELRGDAKSRNISHPRILAMYLSREHTTAAFSEIGRYYGDRNHSTVIAAHRRVAGWLKEDQSLGGRGPKNLKVQEAISAVENLLRIG